MKAHPPLAALLYHVWRRREYLFNWSTATFRYGILQSWSCEATLSATMDTSTLLPSLPMAPSAPLLARTELSCCGILTKAVICTRSKPTMLFMLSPSLLTATGFVLPPVPPSRFGTLRTRAWWMSSNLPSPNPARFKIHSACRLHSPPMATLCTLVIRITLSVSGRSPEPCKSFSIKRE